MGKRHTVVARTTEDRLAWKSDIGNYEIMPQIVERIAAQQIYQKPEDIYENNRAYLFVHWAKTFVSGYLYLIVVSQIWLICTKIVHCAFYTVQSTVFQ
jgi:hypothetical protein